MQCSYALTMLHARSTRASVWPATRTTATARQAPQGNAAYSARARAQSVQSLRACVVDRVATDPTPMRPCAHAHAMEDTETNGPGGEESRQRRVISAGSMHARAPNPPHPCMRTRASAMQEGPPLSACIGRGLAGVCLWTAQRRRRGRLALSLCSALLWSARTYVQRHIVVVRVCP
jgi:hypothetical protein